MRKVRIGWGFQCTDESKQFWEVLSMRNTNSPAQRNCGAQ